MNKETGGPAFPFIDSASPLEHSGMTLRDYFAAKAMQGLMASTIDATLKTFAQQSYKMADAMLEARK
jgi:hypothetical protein